MYYCALPMYHFSFNQHYFQQWGQSIIARMPLSPAQVLWQTPSADLLSHWQQPNLLLSQCCGMPLVKYLSEQVQVVGALHFNVPGCRAADYSSAFIAHAEDSRDHVSQFAGAKFVCNELDSQSGYNAMRLFLQKHEQATMAHFFADVDTTGSHYNSISKVANQSADIASIDCVTLAFLQRYNAEFTRNIKVIGYSDYFPGLPLISAATTDASLIAQLRQAIGDSVHAPENQQLNEALNINGFSELSIDHYKQRIDILKE